MEEFTKDISEINQRLAVMDEKASTSFILSTNTSLRIDSLFTKREEDRKEIEKYKRTVWMIVGGLIAAEAALKYFIR